MVRHRPLLPYNVSVTALALFFPVAVQDFGGRRRVAAVVTGKGLPTLPGVRRGQV